MGGIGCLGFRCMAAYYCQNGKQELPSTNASIHKKYYCEEYLYCTHIQYFSDCMGNNMRRKKLLIKRANKVKLHATYAPVCTNAVFAFVLVKCFPACSDIFFNFCGSYLFGTKKSEPALASVSLNVIYINGYIDAS